ncbi:MAG TPA: hypothetical protein PKA58_08255 [Polyangium sp.]|nr:hypothetical protein [Polyangium sp.]
MKLRRWFCVGMLGFFSALSMPVRADVAPIPERPVDWDEHPSPMPQEPPDDALARRLVPLAALGLSALTLLWSAKRSRTNRLNRRRAS